MVRRADAPFWTAAACCRFVAGSLLPNHAARVLVGTNVLVPQQAVERKTAAGCSSPNMKTVPEEFRWVIGKTLRQVGKDPRAQHAWHIWRYQNYQKDYGISILNDHADAMLKAPNGDELWNLAWAINSNVRRANGKYLYKFAILSPQYTKAVHDGLEKIVKEGIAKGWDKVRIRVAIQKQLLEWRKVLEDGRQFWY
jgi:hypothetical protein